MIPLETMGEFRVVVIDPPWPVTWYSQDLTLEQRHAKRQQELQERNGLSLKRMPGYAQMPYEIMSIEDISNLPIPSTLHDDALVFLWTTMKMLPHSFGIIEEWGLEYDYTMTWNKARGPKPLKKPMYNSEFIVVGKKGSPEYTDEKMFFTSNHWKAPPRVHSVKPEGFYDLLRRVTPAPRLDIFGRRRIAGFYSWGDEAPEGEPLPDHYQQVLLEA